MQFLLLHLKKYRGQSLHFEDPAPQTTKPVVPLRDAHHSLDAHRITPADLPQVAIVITRGDYPRTTTLVIGPMCCKNELILRNNVGHRFALSPNPTNPPHERFCLIWFVDELQETLPSFHLSNTHRNDRKKKV